MDIVCIIPARGNSKRVPRKNVKLLHGKPLLTYTIEAAIRSGVFANVVVSSEDKEILQVAEQYGATPLLRPEALSGDHVAIADICVHVLDDLSTKGMKYEAFAMMQPTCPLRNAEDVRNAYTLFQKKDTDGVLGVIPCIHPPQRALRITEGYLRPYSTTGENEKCAQELEQLYLCNGAVTFAKTKAFLQEKTLFLKRGAPYVMSQEHGVDIDEPIDFLWVEFLLSRQS